MPRLSAVIVHRRRGQQRHVVIPRPMPADLMAMAILSFETSADNCVASRKNPVAAMTSPTEAVLRGPILAVSLPPIGATNTNISASGTFQSRWLRAFTSTAWKRNDNSTSRRVSPR